MFYNFKTQKRANSRIIFVKDDYSHVYDSLSPIYKAPKKNTILSREDDETREIQKYTAMTHYTPRSDDFNMYKKK